MASFFWQCFLDSVYPKHCLICDKEGFYFCADCKQKSITPWIGGCFGCGVKTANGKLCKKCELVYAFDTVHIVADYDDEIIGALIKACKYQFVSQLATELGILATKYVQENSLKGVLVPVPLSAKRQRWRGFNQVEEIAKVISVQNNLEISNCLERVQNKKAQAKLSEAQRLVNMQGCYKAIGEVPEAVLLIDDVVTTGATINECAKILRQAGAEEIHVLALAKG